jgi:hypothetical protein
MGNTENTNRISEGDQLEGREGGGGMFKQHHTEVSSDDVRWLGLAGGGAEPRALVLNIWGLLPEKEAARYIKNYEKIYKSCSRRRVIKPVIFSKSPLFSQFKITITFRMLPLQHNQSCLLKKM